MLFYVLFVCKCVFYYCHRVTTQMQLTNISYISGNRGKNRQKLNIDKVRGLTTRRASSPCAYSRSLQQMFVLQ